MKEVAIIFLMVFFSWLAAELLKFVVASVKERKINIHSIIKYGGFPSAHAALVTSLAFSIYWMEGFTISFLIAVALMFIVIRDTITLRRTIDKNSKNISKLTKEKAIENEIKMIAHTNIQIFGGILVGIVIPLLIYLLI